MTLFWQGAGILLAFCLLWRKGRTAGSRPSDSHSGSGYSDSGSGSRSRDDDATDRCDPEAHEPGDSEGGCDSGGGDGGGD